MTNLMINDLSRTEELERKAMAGVRGGNGLSAPMPGLFDFDFRSFFKSFNTSSSTQSVFQVSAQTFNAGNNSTVLGSQSQTALNVNEQN